MISRLIASGAAMVLIGIASPGAAVPQTVKADPVAPTSIVACTVGVMSLRFQPGILALTPRNTTATTRFVLTSCASVGFPSDSSARLEIKQPLSGYTCVELLQPLNLVPFTIHWRSGATSTVANGTQQIVGVTVVLTGAITAGRYVGKTFVASVTVAPIVAPVECLGLIDTLGATDVAASVTAAVL